MPWDGVPRPPSYRSSREGGRRPMKVVRKGRPGSTVSSNTTDGGDQSPVVWRFIKDEPVLFKTISTPQSESNCLTATEGVQTRGLPFIPGEVCPRQKVMSYSHHLRCAGGKIELNNALTNPLPKIVAMASCSPLATEVSVRQTLPDPDKEHSYVLPPNFGNPQSDFDKNCWVVAPLADTKLERSQQLFQPDELPDSVSQELRQLLIKSSESDSSTIQNCKAAYEAEHPSAPSWGIVRSKKTSLTQMMEKRGGSRGFISFQCRLITPAAVIAILATSIYKKPLKKAVHFLKKTKSSIAVKPKPNTDTTTDDQQRLFRQLLESDEPIGHRKDEIGRKMRVIYEDLQNFWRDRCGDPTSVITDVDQFDILVDMKRENTKKHPLSGINLASSCPEELQNLATTLVASNGFSYTVPVISGDTASALLNEEPVLHKKVRPKELPHKKRFRYAKWYMHPSTWASGLKHKKSRNFEPPLQVIAERADIENRKQFDNMPTASDETECFAFEEVNPLGSYSHMSDAHKERVIRLQERQRQAEEHFKKRGLYRPVQRRVFS